MDENHLQGSLTSLRPFPFVGFLRINVRWNKCPSRGDICIFPKATCDASDKAAERTKADARSYH